MKTPQELVSEWNERITWPKYAGYTKTDKAPFGYDAAWAIALMLNKSAEVLKEKVFADGQTRRLEDFTYDDDEMAQMFFDLLKDSNFDGMTVIKHYVYLISSFVLGICPNILWK